MVEGVIGERLSELQNLGFRVST